MLFSVACKKRASAIEQIQSMNFTNADTHAFFHEAEKKLYQIDSIFHIEILQKNPVKFRMFMRSDGEITSFDNDKLPEHPFIRNITVLNQLIREMIELNIRQFTMDAAETLCFQMDRSYNSVQLVYTPRLNSSFLDLPDPNSLLIGTTQPPQNQNWIYPLNNNWYIIHVSDRWL